MKTILRAVTLTSIALALLAIVGAQSFAQQPTFRHPQPGDVYKEYIRLMVYDVETRVIWPLATDPRAQAALPNPTLDITVDDLDGATRAELVIDFWGGHAGTVGEQISFNGHDWLDVPVLNTVPESPECYTNMRNITMDIPLAHLNPGLNHFVGNSGGQTCNNFQWGMWGWYGVILRVYYSNSKPHATGTISSYTSGSALPENPVIAASVNGSVSRVDFLAYYDGYDEDGDGVYQDYHQSYHTLKYEYALPLRYNIGSATNAPWQTTWNTEWLPDQAPGSVKLIARICDANGYWYVTPEVTNLTMQRSGRSVRIYRPTDVPTLWQTRASNLMTCHIPIPSDHDLTKATAVQFHMRTWNGQDGGEASDGSYYYYTKVNEWYTPQYGASYFYSYDVLDVPVSAIANGSNTISYFATSMGHGIELLWPGPALVVKYSSNITSSLPGTPVLASPANNSTNTVRTPSLSWNSVSSASVYQLQVATDQAFTTLVYSDSSLTGTSHTMPELAPLTQYFWHVRAGNTSGWGAYSSPWSFTTTTLPPGTPLLDSPANGAASLSTNPTLRWFATSGATSYWLQVGTDQNFSSGFFSNDSTLTDTLATLTGLTNNTVYYWRVGAANVAGTSAFSTARSFTTTIGLPGTATLLAPANNAANQAITGVICKWNSLPTAAQYRFQLATDSAFASGIVRNDSTLTDTTQTLTGLVNGTTYYWRVAGRNADGTGPYSTPWHFTTIVPPPGAVILVGPADNAAGAADSMKCIWHPTTPASAKYWFEIARDSSFTLSRSVDSTLTDTSKTVHGLVSSTKYYWRVRGGNAAGWGLFSSTRRFTPLFTSVVSRDGLPTGITLNQNFPNPFNPTTQIEFGLPKESHAKLEVYGVLGDVVLTLFDGVLSAGYHRVTVNAEQLPSGVYLYRLTTPESSVTRKMLLVR